MKDCGAAMVQSPTHSTPRAASSSAYAVVWLGPPNDANALISVATRIASAFAVTSSSGGPLARSGTRRTRASVRLVVRVEEVDVLLDRGELVAERLVAAAPLEERLLEEVGLRLVDRDDDLVAGDARAPSRRRCRHPSTARRTEARTRAAPRPCRVVVSHDGSPVDLLAGRFGFVERERERSGLDAVTGARALGRRFLR